MTWRGLLFTVGSKYRSQNRVRKVGYKASSELGWERNDELGQHQQLFLDVLRRIDTRIARLKSWNGLVVHVLK